jgi:hypothetical protein
MTKKLSALELIEKTDSEPHSPLEAGKWTFVVQERTSFLVRLPTD